ncbi:hypothetical protein ACNI74_00530 [Mycoplasmoides pneumoniae]
MKGIYDLYSFKKRDTSIVLKAFTISNLENNEKIKYAFFGNRKSGLQHKIFVFLPSLNKLSWVLKSVKNFNLVFATFPSPSRVKTPALGP